MLVSMVKHRNYELCVKASFEVVSKLFLILFQCKGHRPTGTRQHLCQFNSATSVSKPSCLLYDFWFWRTKTSKHSVKFTVYTIVQQLIVFPYVPSILLVVIEDLRQQSACFTLQKCSNINDSNSFLHALLAHLLLTLCSQKFGCPPLMRGRKLPENRRPRTELREREFASFGKE